MRIALLLVPLALVAACGSSNEVVRHDDGRLCRLAVRGRPGRYRAEVEVSGRARADHAITSRVLWRARGGARWHPVDRVGRADPGGGRRVVALPDILRRGDLVRLEAVWLDAAGGPTWRRTLEAAAP